MDTTSFGGFFQTLTISCRRNIDPILFRAQGSFSFMSCPPRNGMGFVCVTTHNPLRPHIDLRRRTTAGNRGEIQPFRECSRTAHIPPIGIFPTLYISPWILNKSYFSSPAVIALLTSSLWIWSKPILYVLIILLSLPPLIEFCLLITNPNIATGNGASQCWAAEPAYWWHRDRKLDLAA